MGERVAARMVCATQYCPTPIDVPCGDWDLPAVHSMFMKLGDGLAETLQDFGLLNFMAQWARCGEAYHTGEWPPVFFVHSLNFKAVERLEFRPTLLGKYFFRIHSAAGVRS